MSAIWSLENYRPILKAIHKVTLYYQIVENFQEAKHKASKRINNLEDAERATSSRSWSIKSRLCSRHRHKGWKTSAKGEVWVILSRRYGGTYGKQKNRKIPSKRNSNVFQAAVGGYCITWVNKALFHWQTISFQLSPFTFELCLPRWILTPLALWNEVAVAIPLGLNLVGPFNMGIPKEHPQGFNWTYQF